MEKLLATATANVKAILTHAIQLTPPERAYVIYDTEAPLTRLMVAAYRNALPDGTFIDFSQTAPEEVLALFDRLHPKDLVVLVQSTNFRLSEFRIRIELFKRDLKVIEHTHLGRMSEDQFERVIDEFAYDPAYYRHLGPALKSRIDAAQHAVIECAGTQLVYPVGFEEAKLNIGDYTGMKNIGGAFPIGEVFTESRDIAAVHGDVKLFAFATEDHVVREYEPFVAHVENGVLTAPDAPADFQRILDLIRADEEVLVRELGFGLNPAVGKGRLVNDINTFERMAGIHLSLGEKHGIYPKPGLKRKEGRYHVDVFADATRVLIDGEPVFANGTYLV